MRSSSKVRNRILFGIGGSFAVAASVACGGRTEEPSPGAAGAAGMAGTAATTGSGATGGAGGSDGTTGTGGAGSGATGGAGGDAGATGGGSAGSAGIGGAAGAGGSAGATGGSGGSSGGTGGATGGRAGASGETGGGPAGTGGSGGAQGGTGGSAGTQGGTAGSAGGWGGTGGGGGTGGTGGIRDAGCAPPDGGDTPVCVNAGPAAPVDVCFTEAALVPYRVTPPDPNRDVCSNVPTSCPSVFEFNARNFCGGVLWNSLGLRAEQCCYSLMPGPVDGRPFLVDGEARCADVVERSDWLDRARHSPRALSREEREELAKSWLSDATAEHASVASFARLSLELLSLGAPPELIVDAQRAALDEIEHARLCFGLASRYRGQPCGPGPLSVDRAVRDVTLSELAVAAVREGCVGETMAAVLAGERLERATDPDVRAALAKIADDETRHAELAWRTVIWAIEQGGWAVYEAVRVAFAEAAAPYLSDLSPVEGSDTSPALAAHGRLAAAAARRVERSAAREIVVPLAAALESLVARAAA